MATALFRARTGSAVELRCSEVPGAAQYVWRVVVDDDKVEARTSTKEEGAARAGEGSGARASGREEGQRTAAEANVSLFLFY